MNDKRTIYPVTTEIEEETDARGIAFMKKRLAEQRAQQGEEKNTDEVILNGTKLLKLYTEKTITYEQLKKASQIIKIEREKFSNKDEENEAAEAKALELVTALNKCKTEEEKNDVFEISFTWDEEGARSVWTLERIPDLQTSFMIKISIDVLRGENSH